MSSFYRTCTYCAFEKTDCARRNEFAKSIKGLGITSVRFKCGKRTPLFDRGQRVLVTFTVYSDDGWGSANDESWPATVVMESRKGFLIAVDDTDSDLDTPALEFFKSDTLYCNVAPHRLAALAEPDRKVCQHCNNAEDDDGKVPGCWGDESPFDSDKCMLREPSENHPTPNNGAMT